MAHTRGRWTNISIQRLALFVVLSTILLGQATLVKAQGTFADVAGLYRLSAGALIVYAFYPQVVYLERKARAWATEKGTAWGGEE